MKRPRNRMEEYENRDGMEEPKPRELEDELGSSLIPEKKPRGIPCKWCGAFDNYVLKTRVAGGRRRFCRACSRSFETRETAM